MTTNPERGGPTTQAGIHFQNCVAVLRLSHMLCGEEMGGSVMGQIVSVRIEAPTEVDDVVVTYADGRREFIQVKLVVGSNSDAWDKLWQHFYREYEGFVAEAKPGNVITLAARWSPEMSALEGLFVRVASAESAAEWRSRLTQQQAKLADNIAAILKLDDDALFKFCRVVKVWQLKFEGDPLETDTFESEVRRVLKGTLEPLTNVFPILLGLAADAASYRRTISREELVAELRRRGFNFLSAGGSSGRSGNGGQLSDRQRKRLEDELDSLSEMLAMAQKRLGALRKAYLVEAGAAIKFQLEQQISDAEADADKLQRRIDEIEAKLN